MTAFHPAFDMPETAEQALAVIAAWGDPGTMTFNHERAKRAAELLRRDVACETCALEGGGHWLRADDTQRLVRELDVALNGESGAAKQASLCDIVAQVKGIARNYGQPLLACTPADIRSASVANKVADYDNLCVALRERDITITSLRRALDSMQDRLNQAGLGYVR